MKMPGKTIVMPDAESALLGRREKMPVPERHYVNGNPMLSPYPEGFEMAMFGLGCFWGAERKYWQQSGVYITAVGYSGGYTPNPTYEEVCSGLTGHNEVVRVIYDPFVVSYQTLLRIFWESHNPTQGMRQGNDIGTQYRSGIYVYNDGQRGMAVITKEKYQSLLVKNSMGSITTEILDVSEFYFAEAYHQQYLARNPGGYCGLGGCGISLEEL